MSAIKKLITAALALIIACAPAAMAAPRYNTKEAELSDFTIKGTFNVSVVYQVSASSALYDPAAIMNEIVIAPGQSIEAGDTIATYTAPVSDVDIARAETALAQAQDDHEYELAQRTMVIDEYRAAAAEASDPDDARMYELMAQRAELELEQYRADGEAEIASLTARRDAAVASSELKNVSAPISGTVAYTRKIDAGTQMNGREIAGIFDPSTIIFRVSDPDGVLKYGMKVELALDGEKSAVISGTVVSADNVLPGALRTGNVWIVPDEYPGDKAFSGGKLTAVTITVPDVVVVSNSTLQYSNGQCFVRILDSDGTVRTRYVRLGMTGANESWVLYGVEPGDKLIAK